MSPENEVVAELRQSVDELRVGVLALGQRVSVLSASLVTVNELQRTQQELGDKAVVAVERANDIAAKLEEVKQTVVSREEVDRKARIEVIRRHRVTRRITIALLAFLISLYGTIFAVAPIENQLCVISGPRTVSAQSLCNAISPFESHPLGGRNMVAKVLQEQIIRNNKRIDRLDSQVADTLALANAERAKRHRPPLPVLPVVTSLVEHNSPPSQYDWTSKSTLVVGMVLFGGAVCLLVWTRRNDELDSEESASIQ